MLRSTMNVNLIEINTNNMRRAHELIESAAQFRKACV
jgi:hypothetical protein